MCTLSQSQSLLGNHSVPFLLHYDVALALLHLLSCIINLFLSTGSFPSTSNMLCLLLKNLLLFPHFSAPLWKKLLELIILAITNRSSILYQIYSSHVFTSITHLNLFFPRPWMICVAKSNDQLQVIILLGWPATFHAATYFLLAILVLSQLPVYSLLVFLLSHWLLILSFCLFVPIIFLQFYTVEESQSLALSSLLCLYSVPWDLIQSPGFIPIYIHIYMCLCLICLSSSICHPQPGPSLSRLLWEYTVGSNGPRKKLGY